MVAIIKRPSLRRMRVLGKRFAANMTFTISGKADSNENSPNEGGADSPSVQTRMPAMRPTSQTKQSQSARDQVMIEFQRTALEMASKFLETQQRVMLTYLGQGQSRSTDSVGIELTKEPPLARAITAPEASHPQYSSHPVDHGMQYVAANLADPIVTAPQAVLTAAVEDTGLQTASVQVLASAGPDTIDAPALIASLIEIVSERTGYPPEMLDPALDLEADLGIDSIKRVEILNTFRKLLPDSVQHSLEDGIERLAGVKTLQGIMDWISSDLCDAAGGTTGEHGQNRSIEHVMNNLGSSSMAALRAADLDLPDAASAALVSAGARLRYAEGMRSVSGGAVFTLVMDNTRDLFLKDHTFDGVPVMPMAYALELMCEAAIALHPDLAITAVSNMEIPAGIVFESDSKTIVVTAETEKSAEHTTVRAAVCTEGAFRRAHFKAVIELAPELAPVSLPASLPAKFGRLELTGAVEAPTVSQVYSKIMFHGPLFQGISSVMGLGANAVAGALAPTPVTKFIATEIGARWEIDPVLLDSAMQLAGIWGRTFLDVMLLPAGFAALRKVRPIADSQYYAVASIPPDTSGIELHCDLAVYSSTGELVLFVEGLRGIGTKALNRLSSK